MTGKTQVFRPVAGLAFHWILVVVLATLTALLWIAVESSWPALALGYLALAAGRLTWTGIHNQRIVIGDHGVFVVADDGAHTLGWDRIRAFEAPLELEVHLIDGRALKVEWVRTGLMDLMTGNFGRADRMAMRLNELMAQYTHRSVPDAVVTRAVNARRSRYARYRGLSPLIFVPVIAMWVTDHDWDAWIELLLVCGYAGSIVLWWLVRDRRRHRDGSLPA